MAWIESHTVLLRHRKVLQLATDLNIPAVQVVGHLHALWHSVLEQQENGDLTDWPDDMIAQAAAYTGSASTFVSSLQSRKWLDGKIIHDWMDYAGRYLLMKYRTSNPKRLLQIQKLHQSVSRSVSSPTKVRPKSDNLTKPNHPNHPNQTRPNLTKPNQKTSGDDSPVVNGIEAWNAYENAYTSRYGVHPVRNKTINSILKQVVVRLGINEAPLVAAFYLSHNDPFYVRKRHPVGLLLQDAESLRTQWATGTKATTGEMKNAEFKDNVVEQVKRIEALRQGERT